MTFEESISLTRDLEVNYEPNNQKLVYCSKLLSTKTITDGGRKREDRS